MTIREYFEKILGDAEYDRWHDIRKYERAILKMFQDDEPAFEKWAEKRGIDLMAKEKGCKLSVLAWSEELETTWFE